MKIVYMGTPDFSVGALEALLAAGHEVVAVVTQPDKPRGRGKEMQVTSVKECALSHNIPVFQPVRIKTAEAVEELRKFQADIFVVAAFGQLLSKEILEMPKYGCINIHASLLPKYRGAAPIQWAILDGEAETGVTIMQMDVGLDTGDMLLKRAIPILNTDTGESLHDKLAVLGAQLIVEALEQIEQGTISPVKQEESETCYARMLDKKMGCVDFATEAVVIERLIRGLNSWPSAYTYLDGKTMKIWEAAVVTEEEIQTVCSTGTDREEPGTIVAVDKEAIYVKTGKDFLKILQIQMEGKKRMSTREFMLGHEFRTGTILGIK